jgi:hypothetical protein
MDGEDVIIEQFEKLTKDKVKITSVYVLKVTSGGLQLVNEGKEETFGPIGGRVARMDDNGALNYRDTLAREYASETGSLLPYGAELIKVTTNHDCTQKYLYENHFYLWRADNPIKSKRVKTFQIPTLMKTDNDIPLRPWFRRALTRDAELRNALYGQQTLCRLSQMGTRMIGDLWYLYVLPELNPGLHAIYRVGIEVGLTDSGTELVYVPKKVSWSVVKADVKKSDVGLKSGVIVPKDLDGLRIRSKEQNIMDIVKSLPKKQGDDSDMWNVFPMSEYYTVGATN